MDEVVAEAWSWLHEERKDVITKSFRQVGISLKPDETQDYLLHIRDLPNLVVGDWILEQPDNASSTYGLDCNLSSDGHTGVGTLEFELHDDDLIDEDFFNEYAPQENQGDGDYVLDDELEIQGSRIPWYTGRPKPKISISSNLGEASTCYTGLPYRMGWKGLQGFMQGLSQVNVIAITEW
ncbi:hypothetical protein L211DRAFT_866873 [Terfezia boudieri ATCC MYA-4762]|uniref:Uncharacterized protein n=1 Tax=Terfezia boudieri ATCC MYA-4762 TaxID=1051890 RepID=A0A3N4LSY8_9PEZI|nr:hypothetical protein L211DRAFT_866873 [Terfezia boudieri ATCC MYA-4762]